MEQILMILEVSRKQEYIFASKKLRENAARSDDIRYVTSSDFFSAAAGMLYRPAENLVYSGGGHAVLQFDGKEAATAFARTVTEAVLRQYDGLELFVKQRQYDPSLTPGENLEKLIQALEAKKSRRQASFRRLSFGVEALDPITFLPAADTQEPPRRSGLGMEAPEGWKFPAEFEELAGNDNFIAVVHADGNAMGKRIDQIYETHTDWDSCRQALNQFSKGIQQDFEHAFREMVQEVIRWKSGQMKTNVLPVRPVILAGDDVCFVTAGNIGLECARIFLEKLTTVRPAFGGPYAACAGVVLVHKKFPFHQAYDLSEALCSSAKRFGAELDAESRISALDWHIEFGQLKDSLHDIREDYLTEDGGHMELRPVTVVVPDTCPDCQEKAAERSYAFFRQTCRALQREGNTGRGKIKDLRNAFKQGELETRFFIRKEKIGHLLKHIPPVRGEQVRQAAFQTFLEKDGQKDRQDRQVRRCLLFDAVEMIDHCEFEEGAI